MKAAMSARTKYFLFGIAGHKLKYDFSEMIHNIHSHSHSQYRDETADKSNDFYSKKGDSGMEIIPGAPIYKTGVDRFFGLSSGRENSIGVGLNHVTINPRRDVNGEPIKENHPYFELSKAMTNFQIGSETKYKKEYGEWNIKKISSDLKNKGKHFTAGYLTKFGDIAKSNEDNQGLGFLIRKLTQRIPRKVALNVWKQF
ncbi:hypothetical protein HOD29_05805 [archaeon]|jgi:hypothetical protein|nr:hypothetical protein [archaeon]